MDAPDRALERTARAALVLATLLVLRAAWPGNAPPDASCARPVSAVMEEGRTVAVRCDEGPGPALAGPARLLFGLRLDPNRADVSSLAVLPGIGTERAEAIVRARSLAPFERAEDLARVPGIGEATIERLRPWLSFETDARATTPPVDPREAGK